MGSSFFISLSGPDVGPIPALWPTFADPEPSARTPTDAPLATACPDTSPTLIPTRDASKVLSYFFYNQTS